MDQGVNVTDYRCEQVNEECEGFAYKAEMRKIREESVLADSFLFTWGDGHDGKLGHQSEESLFVPYNVTILQRLRIKSCALGRKHSLFLSAEGTVFACGNGQYGQLGTGSALDFRSTPVHVQGLQKVRQLAAGDYHSIALLEGGALYSWGSGSWGKLGLATDSNVTAPRVIAALTTSIVEQVACGSHHTVCSTFAGDVWSWGKGLRGQLGHGAMHEEYSPRLVSRLRKQQAFKISCGRDHTLVLCNGGILYSFGANGEGELGLGDSLDRFVPEVIESLRSDPVTDIAAKGHKSLVLTTSGRVLMFGDAELRNLFYHPTHIHVIPKGDPIVSVASTENRAYAVSEVGNIYRWGSNDVNLDADAATLEPFHAIKGVIRLYAGCNHQAAICAKGHGLTQAMITREKSTTHANEISKASEHKEPDEVIAHPLQITNEFLDELEGGVSAEAPSREGDGFVYTYGKGVDGRLGHGLTYSLSQASKLRPCRVEKLSKMTIAKVICGKDSTGAITDTGKLYTWGNQQFGKTGHGSSRGCVVVPRLVESLRKRMIVKCSMGRNHTLCLSDDNRFFSWGSNTFGQLGIPNVTNYLPEPLEISMLREKNVMDFSAGGFHSLVVTWSHDMYSCGKGWHGQLGQGDYESLTAKAKTLPQFTKLTDNLGSRNHKCVRVFGGIETSAALTDTGRLFTWGQGTDYQLGHGDSTDISRPKEVERLGKLTIVDVALGKSHCIALDSLGTPWGWGRGDHGQLGISEKGERQKVPVQIELCKRAMRKEGTLDQEIERVIAWGSFYMEKDEGGGNEASVAHKVNPGKVIQVSANNNFSVFILERFADASEIRAFRTSEEGGGGLSKKMTPYTRIRELFCCGSGKGGVMQNQGKENEYIPKLMPFAENDMPLQDVVQVAAGRSHIAILCREELLGNVEASNKELASRHDKYWRDMREVDAIEHEVIKYQQEESEREAKPVTVTNENPFDLERREELTQFFMKLGVDISEYSALSRKIFEQGIDLQTLSVMRSDDDLKAIGISSLGARRRLLKRLHLLPRAWSPTFYAYQNSQSFFLSWPPSAAADDERRARDQELLLDQEANPFTLFLQKKASGKIFNALVRYAEGKHYESISDRANIRYQGEADGVYKLFMWGVGSYGRLGHGYGMSYAVPHVLTTFPPRTKILRVALGAEHSVACSVDGAVFTWGNGNVGQLGTTENYEGVGVNVQLIPRAVEALARSFVVLVAAGRWHNLVLTNDRAVWAWGDGKFGQLGLDSTSSQGLPARLKALDGRFVCSLHCGGWHSAAINESGKIFLWGKNAFGQLGLRSINTINHPRVNKTLRSIGKVRTAALGADHTLVVMVDNMVYSFGLADHGQLGLASLPKMVHSRIEHKYCDTPQEIVDLTNCNVCQVAAGDMHSMALSIFGEVWSWGGSPFGQLGHGNIIDTNLPTPLLPQRHNIPPNILQICAGYTYSMALTDTGDVFSWGQGESGELGHASKILMYAPSEIQDLKRVRLMAAGQRHSAAVCFIPQTTHVEQAQEETTTFNKSTKGTSFAASSTGGSGTVTPRSGSKSQRSLSKSALSERLRVHDKKKIVALVWGSDTTGQLGMRGLQSARSPTVLRDMAAGSANITHVAAGPECSAFVTDKGKLYMCGSGDHGRLGLGHTNTARTPLLVSYFGEDHAIEKVACGIAHTLCMTSKGRVFAWGDGTWGNAGIITQSDVVEPQELSSLSSMDIVNVVAGGYHSFALSSEGFVFAWGKNTNGQLGLGIITPAEISPRKIENAGGTVLEVVGGCNHSAIIAKLSPPNLLMFGMNANGQLGLDDQVDRSEPTPVNDLNDRVIVSVGCGTAHTAAVSQYGDVIVWGNGRSGQLGLFEGVETDFAAPHQLPPFCRSLVTKVVCGSEITCAITEEGQLFLWGSENSMGLGGNQARDTANPYAPKEVEGLDRLEQVAVGSMHIVARVVSLTCDDANDEE